MDVIKKIAFDFGHHIQNYGYTFEKFDGKLGSMLLNISKTSEKLRLLSGKNLANKKGLQISKSATL